MWPGGSRSVSALGVGTTFFSILTATREVLLDDVLCHFAHVVLKRCTMALTLGYAGRHSDPPYMRAPWSVPTRAMAWGPSMAPWLITIMMTEGPVIVIYLINWKSGHWGAATSQGTSANWVAMTAQGEEPWVAAAQGARLVVQGTLFWEHVPWEVVDICATLSTLMVE